tara:strand:+ start:4620 stop:5735 length:1116 start_codon:yes stop_codon:yes gene_type:complete
MKICYISNSASPSRNASSLQIAKLCEYISKNGHEVKLILPGTGLKKNFFKFYGIKFRYRIKKLNLFKKFPTGFYYYLYSFVAIIKSNIKKQDLYITRNFFTSLILSIFKKKHILEIHDDINIEGRIVQFLVKYFRILNSNFLIKIVTTTHTLRKKYEQYGIDKKKIFTFHNASSLVSTFKKSKKKKSLKIGYFGSIFKSRGIDMIIKLSILDKKNNYLIYGGSLEEIKDIKKNVKNKNIKFMPYLPYSEVSKKLKNIDICILPYTSKITVSGNVGDISKFTSPLKIFDYMKLGKLIISSNLNVLKEILADKKNCLLINNYKDEYEWQKTISSVSKNFDRFDTIRKNAFDYANKFDLNWRVKKLISIEKTSK